MEAMLFVYFAGIVEQLQSLGFAVSITLCFVLAGAMLWYAISRDVSYSDYRNQHEGMTDTEIADLRSKKPAKLVKQVSVALFVVSLVTALLPTQKTAYYMAGAYLGQQALQSDMAKDAYRIIELKVKGYVVEMEQSLQKSQEKAK